MALPGNFMAHVVSFFDLATIFCDGEQSHRTDGLQQLRSSVVIWAQSAF